MSVRAAATPSRSVRYGNPSTLVVATVPVPDEVRMPDALREEVGALAWYADEQVVVSGHDVPFGAPEWVACHEAHPHRDPCFRESLFLTLCVEAHAEHRFADALSHYTAQAVRRGDLLVLDPLVPHWLIGPQGEARTPWAAVQWTVPRAEAKDTCREIVARLGGRWQADRVDPRYAEWLPKKRTAGRTLVITLPSEGKSALTIAKEDEVNEHAQLDKAMVPEREGWRRWEGGQDAPPDAMEASCEGDVQLAYRDGTRGLWKAGKGSVPLPSFR